jgi:hypothetical protein
LIHVPTEQIKDSQVAQRFEIIGYRPLFSDQALTVFKRSIKVIGCCGDS